MRIAIVEDDKQTNKQLKQYVTKFYDAQNQSVDIDCYFDGEEITENYKCDYDIILMDIEMKFVDGISAAEYIRRFDEKVIIIFITNSVKYAVKCYVVNAQGYIVKPVNYFALSEELSRAKAIVVQRRGQVCPDKHQKRCGKVCLQRDRICGKYPSQIDTAHGGQRLGNLRLGQEFRATCGQHVFPLQQLLPCQFALRFRHRG